MNGLKKRGALFVLLLALALIAAACSSSSDETTTTATETTAAAETTTTAGGASGEGVKVGLAYDIGGRGDKSFNDSAAAGLDRAIADYGIETQELEPTAGGENRLENLNLLAESGFNLIFAIGFAYAEHVEPVAADYPETSFGLVDSVVDAPNVASLVFAEHEGSALVGAAAALKSQTGIIGFIGGVNVALINKFEAGYKFGAEQITPDIEVLVQYLTESPDFSGFNDPAKGKEAALAMYENGADVVYHAAGGSGGGLFEAAKEVSTTGDVKVWAIGVDSDQYETSGEDVREYILTSMIKRVDVAVYKTITDYVNNGSVSGINVFDLGADGVGYSTSGGFIDDITDQINELRDKIIAGEIVVPDPTAG